VQEIGSQEDAATEAHEQREDSPATIAVSVDARYHMMRDHSEYERQQKRQDEANQLRQPTLHLSICCIQIKSTNICYKYVLGVYASEHRNTMRSLITVKY